VSFREDVKGLFALPLLRAEDVMTTPLQPQRPFGPFQPGMPSFFPAAVFVVLVLLSIALGALLSLLHPGLGDACFSEASMIFSERSKELGCS
jgi:hypothetical protein